MFTTLIVILSLLLAGSGFGLVYWCTRNPLSGLFISAGVWVLTCIGGGFFLAEDGHEWTLLVISGGLFCYGLGAAICATIMRFRPVSELRSFRERPVVRWLAPHAHYYVAFLLCLLGAALLAYQFFREVGIFWLTSDSVMTRAESGQNRGTLIRAILTFLPLSLLFAYAYYRSLGTVASRILLALAALASLAALVAGSSRGAVLWYLVPGLITLGYLKNKVGVFRLAVLFGAFLVLALLIQQFTYRDYASLSPVEGLLEVVRRATRSQAEGIDYIIYGLVPQYGYFWGGIAGWDFKAILATLRITSGHEMPFVVWLWQQKAGVALPFTLSSTTLGDLYADFGIAGVCIGMALYGYVTQWLYVRVLRMPKHYFFIVSVAYMQWLLIDAHIGGSMFGVVANRGISLLIYLLAVLFLIIVLSPFTLRSAVPQQRLEGISQ